MKTDTDDYTMHESVRYTKLSVIDTKCGGLLQLSSLLLVFLSISPVYDYAKHYGGYKLLYVALLVACMLCLFVLFYKEHTSEQFVNFRKYVFNTAVVITAVCCLLVTYLVIKVL